MPTPLAYHSGNPLVYGKTVIYGWVALDRETGAPVLGLSSLLTTTFESIREILALLEGEGIREKTFVILGGGATEESLVEKLGVDAQTRDAYEGINKVRAHLQARGKEAAA